MCCEICQLLERLNLTDSKEAQSLFVCTCNVVEIGCARDQLGTHSTQAGARAMAA